MKGGDQLSEKVVVLSVEGYIVLFEVLIKSLRAQNLRDLHQLVVVIVPVEERLLTEDLWVDKVSARKGGVTGAGPAERYSPSRRTCIHSSTCPSYNRTPGNPQEVPDP